MFQVQGIDHIALAVRDVERSAAWYQDVLGLKRIHDGLWGGIPVFIGIGNTALALFPVQGDDPQNPTGKNVIAMRHFAFRVDRPNFLLAQSELKARFIEFEFQDHDISHSIYFHDPDGYEVELTTYEV